MDAGHLEKKRAVLAAGEATACDVDAAFRDAPGPAATPTTFA